MQIDRQGLPVMTRTLALAALLLAACEAKAPVDRSRGDGVTVVESTEPVWTGGDGRLDPVPVLQIGARDGTDPGVFAGLGSVRFLESGKIAAGDSQSDRIHIFDSSGVHVATVGRPGDGPDEFRDLGRIYPFPGDSVAGFDFGLSRTLVFAAQGGAARTISGLVESGRAAALGVLSSGSLISYQNVPTGTGTVSAEWDENRVLLVARQDGAVREVAQVGSAESARGPQRQRRVLAPSGLMASASDGFYWARTDRYEILKHDSLGSVEFVIRRPVEPAVLTEDQKAEYLEASLSAVRENSGEDAAAMYERQLAEAEFAGTRPLFGSAFVDHDQRLWISEAPWPSRFAPPRRWSVFSEEGRWLGDVTAPENLWIHDARGDLAVGVWRDDVHVEYVRVYRLRSGA